MEVRNSNFTAFIDIFTSNTYIMVVMSDPRISASQFSLLLAFHFVTKKCVAESAATLMNIDCARDHFEKFISAPS